MGSGITSAGPISAEDERELVQLFFEMIQNEKKLED